MINFQPFSNLYQGLKPINLFNTIDRIHSYLQSLGTSVDKAAINVSGWTVILAQITPTGTNGSITVNTQGQVTAYTPPT